MILTNDFFAQDAQKLAQHLLGKVLRHRQGNFWLSAMIIETEAYYQNEKASHSSLGFTNKRKALFMSPGTIYMYYARGGDSMNISCQGEGNAVLIKSGVPYIDKIAPEITLEIMQQKNPLPGSRLRDPKRLCSGQTLLCRSLGIKVSQWDQKTFDGSHFYLEDVGYQPTKIIQTTRLGIPSGRDEHLLYRFIDHDYAPYCTNNPLMQKKKATHFLSIFASV